MIQKNLKLITLIITLFLSQNIFANQFVKYCQKIGGQIVNQLICPNSGAMRNETFCVKPSQQGHPLFFNGCSGSIGDYSEKFFKACVLHDFCYHAEPNSNGYSKSFCDEKFLKDMQTICDNDESFDLFNSNASTKFRYKNLNSEEGFRCNFMAKSFYTAVKNFGETSFSCAKEKQDYPKKLNQL